MMKLTTIILFFVISFQSLACDESSINLISQTTNPDGSITYELNLYLDLGGSDVAHYGFTLSFLSSFNTPEVMAGGFDPLISQSDLTSGISDDLVGLIGDDVNSIANDSDWAPYENRTDVLSYESNGIFPSASTDYSMTIFVTVMGCVENIEFDSNTNSGNAACIYTANTGQVCDGCDVSSGNINIIGGTNVGPNEYDLSNCETISFSVTNENLNGGTLTYGWAIFSCEPNLPFNAAEISNFNNNPCYLGSDYGTSTSDIDAGGISGTIIGGYEQLWILPYTSDIADALDGNGDGCFDFADAIQVNYIPPTCGTCADPGCTSGSVNTFEDRTYLSCNNPCADLNNTTYITHHTVTTDAFGNVGVVQQINFSQFSCSELSRSAVLREAVNSCSGPDILPTITNANGVGSGFNPEWIGLNPNTNYTLIINTIIGSDCDYDFGCLDFYGIQGCSANAGVTDIITSNTSNSDYVLCFNETIDLTTTNYTLPNVSANSSMGYALYNCEPTTNDPATDVCFTGQYVIGDAANSVNNGTFAPAIAAPNQTVWLVPITMDMATPPVFNHDSDEDGCFALGAPIEISYLNPITASNINDCNSGSVTISINGGYPEFFSGSYNLVNLGSGTLSNTTVGNSGGTVDLTNLNNGDLIELSITDNNGCQEIFTSTFTCFECGNCNTPDCLIAGAYPDYETAADPMNQCSQINLMASNPVNDGVFTSYHQVVSSPDGTLGVIITSGVNDVGAGSCTVNRLANLYPINGPCTIGTGIVPIPPAQGWLPIYNPEFTGLTPNTTYILQVTFTVPLGCELVDHCESYYYPEICQITDISGVILNCDPVDNTYSAEVTVSYSSNPENGTLDIYMPDSHSFAITTSPQTLVIDGLSADGQMVDVSAAFSDENSCSSTALDLFEAPSIQDCGIIIPTAFTPDGDNVNDFWSLENIDEIYPNNKVFIYNRWGNIIFESQAGSYEQYPWSGTFNGEKLPVGSFYYIIDYNDGYTDTSNGTVSILK
jgi:gliding motility-associated-like protein